MVRGLYLNSGGRGLGVELGGPCGRKCDYRIRFLHPGILRGALQRVYTLEAFCTAFGIEVTEYVYDAYHYVLYWDADPEIKEIRKPELDGYIRHRLSLFEPTGFYLDDVILGPAKQPTEGKVFGDVIEECLTAFFSACCEDVKYTQSQEYFADFAENNEFEFYENDICIRHR